MKFSRISCDVLVLGKGLAGGVAALDCADQGLNVVVVHENDAATNWAQGGIVYKSEFSSDPASLINDVMEAGCQINNPKIVEKVVTQGPQLIQEWLIDRLAVPFDTSSQNSQHDLTREAAHSERRILHVHDHTGKSILDRLNEELSQHKNIKNFEATLIDLLSSDRHSDDPLEIYNKPKIHGAYVWKSSNEVVAIEARATILATGGFASLFQYATGPKSSDGSGIAAAHRAGARTLHMEYVQFHPTVLFANGAPQTLLTEALRGEGAVILNNQYKEFVNSLSPRDVVSRAMHDEMARDLSSHLFLDVSRVKNLDQKFPHFLSVLESYNIDYQNNPYIPIVPAAHYTIGGVWTDEFAKTNLNSLWACGEVACTGLHGANRLASMSLLEALVFGVQAARSVQKELSEKTTLEHFKARHWVAATESTDIALIQQDLFMLKQSLWNYVGLVRSDKRLKRAERLLNDLRNDVETFYKTSVLSRELISLRHGVLVATLCLYASLRNRQSIGTHYLLN